MGLSMRGNDGRLRAMVATGKELHSNATAMSRPAASRPRSSPIAPLNSEMIGLFLLFFLLGVSDTDVPRQIQFELTSVQVFEQPFQSQFDDVPFRQFRGSSARLTVETGRELQINRRVESTGSGHGIASLVRWHRTGSLSHMDAHLCTNSRSRVGGSRACRRSRELLFPAAFATYRCLVLFRSHVSSPPIVKPDIRFSRIRDPELSAPRKTTS